MTQQLRAISALLEDPGSFLASTWQLTTIWNATCRGSDTFLVFQVHTWCIYMYSQNIHVHKMGERGVFLLFDYVSVCLKWTFAFEIRRWFWIP